MRINAFILDIDGTLLDSNDAHARAWQEALDEADLHHPYSEIRRLIGMGGDKLLPTLTGKDRHSSLGIAITRRKREIFTARYLPTIHPFPKAWDLLQKLQSEGMELCMASSADPEELDALLNILNPDRELNLIVPPKQNASSKPDPDLVERALETLQLSPQETRMIGDTPYDIEAAARAGVPTIALRCGGWSTKELHGAIAILNDPADLLERLDEILGPAVRKGAA